MYVVEIIEALNPYPANVSPQMLIMYSVKGAIQNIIGIGRECVGKTFCRNVLSPQIRNIIIWLLP